MKLMIIHESLQISQLTFKQKENSNMDFKKLSKEQIEEASLCKTNEERIAFLSKNKIQLSDEMLDKISGGNDDDEYYCPTCKIRFDNFWDSVLHDLKHLTI